MSKRATVDMHGRIHSPHPTAAHPAPTTFALPGFVNAHSHAFQRALRGRVERRSADHAHDDFWSWRETMYGDASHLSLADIEDVAAWCYGDMLRAGFTAVGEFHYLHRTAAATDDAHAVDVSRCLARAARRVGIRLVLLQTAYARGGYQRPVNRVQRQFAFGGVQAFLDHVRRVEDACAGPGVGVALAVHSVRACPADWIETIARHARDAALPLHIHACEQQRELEECQQEYALSPIALLDRCGALFSQATVVHATHISDADIATIAKRGAIVCITPSTERNLGDGLCPVRSLVDAGVRLCIGSDSHARIDPFDELRTVEENERLRLMRRCVLVQPGDHLAQALLPIGTAHGAASLGLSHADDHVIVDVPLEGRAGDLAAGLDAVLVAGSAHGVHSVAVDGQEVVRGGRLVNDDQTAIEARAVAVLSSLRAA